jgi:hypothetical protein
MIIQEEIIPYHLEYFLGLREEEEIENSHYEEAITIEESQILDQSKVENRCPNLVNRILKEKRI